MNNTICSQNLEWHLISAGYDIADGTGYRTYHKIPVHHDLELLHGYIYDRNGCRLPVFVCVK